ncbi:MAG TPA: membrane dipeptidase [Thermoanaerobaculia bacterium]|nr:membrane dipeptidase [Thermoanaerobaculia bacterium]
MPPVDRRQFLRAGALVGFQIVAGPAVHRGRCRLLAQPSVEVSTRAVDIVLGGTVIDMLGLLTLDWDKLFRWQRNPVSFLETDFRALESAAVNIFHPAVETGAVDAWTGARRWLQGWDALLASQPCFLARIGSIHDLLQQPKMGKVGVLVGFQNSTHFRTTDDVAAFHDLGQQVSQLTYNGSNALGSGCRVARDGGLTEFGTAVVAAMGEVGMAIDVSHCGERTSIETIGASRKPVLITHSNCRSLVPGQVRCKSDRVIRLMAAGGGVMGITAVRAFVSSRGTATIDDWLDHFDHVARLVGVEHVGLGSDVDIDGLVPGTTQPNPTYAIRGLTHRVRVFQLADGLLRRGYSNADVGLVLGHNFRRVLMQIWPDDSWSPVAERETQRDPFCPAARPPDPLGRAGQEPTPRALEPAPP